VKSNMTHLPSEPSFSGFKEKCICCEHTGKLMNKEHFFPQWLLKGTSCEKTLFSSPYGKIPGRKLTIPLCEDCNSKLGSNLEAPVSKIFENIERGMGFNDNDAELLVRWMWKIKGMFYWSICNDNWLYSSLTLKERVLEKIGSPRSRISIGISVIEDELENEEFGYAPIGLSSFTFWSNVYVVGVFSKLSIVVFYSIYRPLINENIWTVYTLSDYPILMNPKKKVFPITYFENGTIAVKTTRLFLGQNSRLEKLHELTALDMRSSIGVRDSDGGD